MAITYKDKTGDSTFPCCEIRFGIGDLLGAMTEFELQYESHGKLERERHRTMLDRITDARRHLDKAENAIALHLKELESEAAGA